jgi:predicted metal-dependent phosphoesterase TrpH
MYRYELHVHTAECDLAAAATASELVRRYCDAGYHGMVVTDHYFSLFYDWFAPELRGLDHRAVMARRLRGYYNARNEGEKLGFTVLPGAEVRFDRSPCGINDFLIYGCEEEFFLTAPRLNELTSPEALAALMPPEACLVWAHPFRVGMTVMDTSALFGVEVHNGGTEPARNRLAAALASAYGLPATAGSDCHSLSAAARGGIETATPIRSPRELSATLRSGAYRLFTGE